MLAELRARRDLGGAGAGAAAPAEALGKGFKPIGFKPIGKQAGDKKKKKKKVADGEEEGRKEEDTVAVAVAERRMAEPLITADVEDEDDIFGDAGEWKPEDDSEDSDEDGDDKTTAGSSNLAPQTRGPTIPASRPPAKYFDDDDDDDLPAGSTAPAAITSLANQPPSADPSASRPLDDGEEKQEQGPMRLEGLSGSSLPSARELLDLDAAQAAEEKRKERKAKFKATMEEKKAMAEANMTDVS